MQGRKTFATILGLALLVPGAMAQAQRERSDFRSRARVALEQLEAARPYGIALSLEAISALNRGAEVRLFDAEGVEVPITLYRGRSRAEVVERPVTLKQQEFDSDGALLVFLDMEEKPGPVSEFQFEIGGSSYQLHVQVSGSHDLVTWQTIAEDRYLFRFSGDDVVHDGVNIRPSRFRHYRFRLREIEATDLDETTLKVLDIQARNTLKPVEWLRSPVVVEGWKNGDGAQTKAYWKIQLPHNNLGAIGLAFILKNREFVRAARLWEWDEEGNRVGRELDRGLLFSRPGQARMGFSGFSSHGSTWIVGIDSGGGETLEPERAELRMVPHEVRFIAHPEFTTPLALYFEPEGARALEYPDLEREIRERGLTHFEPLGHGPLESNPRHGRRWHLLGVLLLLVGAGLLAYGLRRRKLWYHQ